MADLVIFGCSMKRRYFLGLAGAGTGYSVLVDMAGVVAGASGQLTRDEIVGGFEEVAPRGGGRPGTEAHMREVEVACDVFVAGGGMAGVCAALAAARNGAKVVLAQDRSRLGGNSSSEVRMHIVGADCHGSRAGWREGGILEELRLDDVVNNPERSFELWDLLLYDKVKSEAGITLLLESTVFGARTRKGLIEEALVRCDKSEHLYRIRAKVYVDCTGDSRLALEAGAELRRGREGRSEFGESLAPERGDRKTLGSSILFTARDYGRPVVFRAPKWARKITKDQLRFRPISSWEYGYWWIEWGGQVDTIRDNERIRFELLSIVLGVWDYIKNSGEKPSSANWGMEWVGMMPGKRGSRRVTGEHILRQQDLETGGRGFEDAVAIGGWPMDDHPPGGFDLPEEAPFTPVRVAEPYNIPLRCLYSRKVRNLMMAGRNISASHVAFTSTRVMATCAVMGQAAGTAAAMCAEESMVPGELYRDKGRLARLQQRLLGDDQTIIGLANGDPGDLARSASVTASGCCEGSDPGHVINGLVRDLGKRWDNRWAARLAPGGVWVELTWGRAQRVSKVQLTFDTGFHRQLTLSAQATQGKGMIRAAQPETVRDYEVMGTGLDGRRVTLVKVAGNYQRLARHSFPAVELRSLRLHITATNGSEVAAVYEIRCYG
jgi:hypothetical protein